MLRSRGKPTELEMKLMFEVAMIADDIPHNLSCDICYHTYDQTTRLPLQLDCGHTYCKACLLQARSSDCPTCRTRLGRNVSALRPNYALLQLALATCSVDAGAARASSQVRLCARCDFGYCAIIHR